MRIGVERAFGRLKNRWRIILHHLYCVNLDRICKIIHGCCILHNICIDAGDLWLDWEEVGDDTHYGVMENVENCVDGITKRDSLADYLQTIR
jgi:hypothetical protein